MRSILAAVALLGCAMIAEAQQAMRIPRLGFLATVSSSVLSSRTDAFRQGLRTAKQLGLEIPQWTLMKADRVIK